MNKAPVSAPTSTINSRPSRRTQSSADSSTHTRHLPSARGLSATRGPKRASHPNDFNDQYRLLIAIDYGTTFTGVGYVATDSTYPDISQIEVIRNFGNKMENAEKIPSRISYSPCSPAREEQFGADISPEGVAMVHTKLELDQQDTKSDELDLIIQLLEGTDNLSFEHIKAAKGYPDYTWKKAEDVVTDYLSRVFHAFEKATENMSELKLAVPVDVLFTVPVKWSYQAKNSTLRALQAAGFNKDTFPLLRRYMLITEPEAAAIYTARYMKQQEAETLKRGECFVLCDAGGGTVDVVGYKVKQTEPLHLEMVSIPTGSRSGASFINGNFQEWLCELLGEENYNVLDARTRGQRVSGHAVEGPRMRELMGHFEDHKKAFHSLSGDTKLDLPAPLDTLNKTGYIESGELTISNQHMASFFDPCVDEVIYLIQGQMTQIEAKGNRVKSVFLVGGFSESNYLQEQLKESLGMRRMQLRRPETSWSAIVRGAVLSGMEGSDRLDQMTVQMCARSYGISINSSYSRTMHDSRDVFTNPLTGKVEAKGQIMWLVKKGDLLPSEEAQTVEHTIHTRFGEATERSVNVPIFQYPDDDLPDRYETAHEELLNVDVLHAYLTNVPPTEFKQLKNPVTGANYYEIGLICRTVVQGTGMSIELWAGEILLSKVELFNINRDDTGQ